MNRVTKWIGLSLVMMMMFSCSSPEEKKMEFFRKGQALYEEGDYLKARLELKNAIQIDPKFAEAYYVLGLTEMKDKKIRKALGFLNKTVELAPRHMEAQLRLGEIYLAAKEIDKADEKAAAILSIEPDNTDAMILKGAVLAARGEFEAAAGLLEALLKKGITMPKLYIVLSSVYVRDNRGDRVEDILKQGIDHNRDSIALMSTLYNFYSKEKEQEKSIAVLRQMIDLKPDHNSLQFKLADLYWKTGQKQKAETVLDTINQRYASDEDTYINMANFYLAKQLPGRAEEQLKQGIRQSPKSYRIHIALGKLYMNQHEPERAVELVKKCLTFEKDQAAPGMITAKNALTDLYLKMGEFDQAEKYLDEVLRESPKELDALFMKGRIDLMNGKGIDAVSSLRSVVTERPNFIPGYIRLAEAHAFNQDIELAIETLNNAAKIEPASRDLRIMLSRLYVHNRDFSAAEEQLKLIVETNPNDYESLAGLGDLALAQKNPQRAAAIYGRIKNEAPKQAVGYLKMSRFYAAQKKWKKAIAELETGYWMNPNSYPILSSLIQFYVMQKDYKTAIQTCIQRLKKEPENPLVLDLLGRTYMSKKNFQRAEDYFNKAIQHKPEWPSPYNNLARIYMATGKMAKAVSKYEEALKANPKNISAALSLGSMYAFSKDYEKAKQAYQQVLDVRPDLWNAINNLAYLISEHAQSKADYEKALELARKAYRYRPKEPAVLDTLAWVYYRMGDVGKARGLLEEAIRIDPEKPFLNFHLGVILNEQGQFKLAEEKLTKVVESEHYFSGKDKARLILNAIKTKQSEMSG